MLADSQKAQKLKFEVLVPVISPEQPTAVCSFNYHQDHFGRVFEIRTADGEVAHTACLGFGLERVRDGAVPAPRVRCRRSGRPRVRARLWP